MPSTKYTPDPTYIFHQLIDTIRKVLGADQPEKVATILGNDMLLALDMALPIARVYALADLLRSLAEVQAVYSERSQPQPDTTPYIDAPARQTLPRQAGSLDTRSQPAGIEETVRAGSDTAGLVTGSRLDTGSRSQGEAVLNMLHELRNAVGAAVEDYDIVIDRPLRRLLIRP